MYLKNINIFRQQQFLRYIVVGIVNTSFSYGIYAGLVFVGLEFKVASLMALLIGIAFSFVTQGTIVFSNATRKTLVKFILAWVVIYIVNITLISILMRASLNAYIAGAVATVPVTFISYFILKYAVFARKPISSLSNHGITKI